MAVKLFGSMRTSSGLFRWVERLTIASLTARLPKCQDSLGTGPAQLSYRQRERLTVGSHGANKFSQRGVSHFYDLPSTVCMFSQGAPF